MIIDLSPRELRAVKQALSQCAAERRITAALAPSPTLIELARDQAAEYEEALEALPEEADLEWMAARQAAVLQ